MAEAPVIGTRRLNLAPMSLAVMSAVLTGDWHEAAHLVGSPLPEEWRRENWGWLQHHVTEAVHDPSSTAWGPRLLLRWAADAKRQGSIALVGEAGFHGRPDEEGEVEIGYMTAAKHRRQGYAEEAATALLAWAADKGVTSCKASVDPLNGPSINLLCKLGFGEAGRYRHAERGEQLLFRRCTKEPC
jgi:[ribosomal protein S5]-alanine N-acetyltransferase